MRLTRKLLSRLPFPSVHRSAHRNAAGVRGRSASCDFAHVGSPSRFLMTASESSTRKITSSANPESLFFPAGWPPPMAPLGRPMGPPPPAHVRDPAWQIRIPALLCKIAPPPPPPALLPLSPPARLQTFLSLLEAVHHPWSLGCSRMGSRQRPSSPETFQQGEAIAHPEGPALLPPSASAGSHLTCLPSNVTVAVIKLSQASG